MPHLCYDHGMGRMRISTTVDGKLLEQARRLAEWLNDAAMMDAALEALATRYREAEIDAAYEVYDRLPLDEPDEWGDLASFHDANLLHRRELGSMSGGRPERGAGE